MPVPVIDTISPRRLIRDEVFERLLDAIVGGDLLPGEQLVDSEIEQWIGVSRTPVREALNQLAAMGLVEILPQKQTRVTPVDPARISALADMLATLAGAAVQDATPLLTDADREALRSTAKSLAAVADPAALLRGQLADDSTLALFLRRLDNRAIARLVARHTPEVLRAINVGHAPDAPARALPQLTAMIGAALDGDAAAAARSASAFWSDGIGGAAAAAQAPAGGEH
ncbi:GntR family transcriptional regulator [Leifsonia poae]|uniref:GntR family transcriptional regulator n=1 Tax=Leifsonia poae TaxID=110933 RepID=UPI0022F2812C|nr:GntR family transcriptional regulator [Leifsonia poae]